jgi:hypothetical protein
MAGVFAQLAPVPLNNRTEQPKGDHQPSCAKRTGEFYNRYSLEYLVRNASTNAR